MSERGVEIPVYNKYIFSKQALEGKKFYLFSKSFEFPFKVSEIIFISNEDYCFIEPPGNIEDEISSIKNQGGMQNINISSYFYKSYSI